MTRYGRAGTSERASRPTSSRRSTRPFKRAVSENWADASGARDTTVWTDDEKVAALIANRLGWLDLPTHFADEVEALAGVRRGRPRRGHRSAPSSRGMGGSSLAPGRARGLVAAGGTGHRRRRPRFHRSRRGRRGHGRVRPGAARCTSSSSKSGTTTEPLAFLAHFWQVEDEVHHDIRARRSRPALCGRHATRRRASATSPTHDLFREVFLNPADVGGRYSALSYVGLVPGALLGLDLRALLDDAHADGRSAASQPATTTPACGWASTWARWPAPAATS